MSGTPINFFDSSRTRRWWWSKWRHESRFICVCVYVCALCNNHHTIHQKDDDQKEKRLRVIIIWLHLISCSRSSHRRRLRFYLKKFLPFLQQRQTSFSVWRHHHHQLQWWWWYTIYFIREKKTRQIPWAARGGERRRRHSTSGGNETEHRRLRVCHKDQTGRHKWRHSCNFAIKRP